jgi:hypothetical protein
MYLAFRLFAPFVGGCFFDLSPSCVAANRRAPVNKHCVLCKQEVRRDEALLAC